MLELTAKGADKGAMLLRLAAAGRPLGVCAVGDHCNDLPMLRAAAHAFAPENAVAEVRALPGVRWCARGPRPAGRCGPFSAPKDRRAARMDKTAAGGPF